MMGAEPLSVHRSEPIIFSDFRESQEDRDKVLLQARWRLYEDRKKAWLRAWLAYEANKAASTESKWGEYDKVKDEVQRRWREYDQKLPKGIKPPLDLTVDSELAASSRQWWKTDENRRREGSTLWTGMPTVTMNANPVPPSLSRTQSSPISMRQPPPPLAERSNPVPSRVTGTFPRYTTRRTPLYRTAEDPADDRPRQDEQSRRQPLFSQSGFERQNGQGLHESYSDVRAQQRVDDERRKLEAEAAYLQRRERLEREEQARRLAQEARVREEELRKRVEEERQRAEELRRQSEADLRAQEAARRQAEDQRRAEEARFTAERRAQDFARERLKRQQQQQASPLDPFEAWNEYERRWEAIGNGDLNESNLTFASIPWPMNPQPASVQDLNAERIKSFILSPAHSQNKSHKHLLREQLLRFHPDRFETRLLERVRESDRAAVKEGANMVARYLNDALPLYNSL